MMNSNQPTQEQTEPNDLKILDFVFPDGKTPEWNEPPEKTLALIPGLQARYVAARRILDPASGCFEDLSAAQALAQDFFAAWETSSPMVLRMCGRDNALAMLELFAINRELLWDCQSWCDFERIDEDPIEIFRGAPGQVEDVCKGLSWSRRRDFAEMYAARAPGGILLRAEVSREDVLLYSAIEDEIVPRPGSVVNVAQIR